MLIRCAFRLFGINYLSNILALQRLVHHKMTSLYHGEVGTEKLKGFGSPATLAHTNYYRACVCIV